MFRRVADKLNWPKDQMIWKCLDWSTVEEDLAAGDGSCDVAAMGLPTMVEYIEQGIVFSWPTYAYGLMVAVSNQQATVSMWAFLDAFEWQLWVAIIVTALGIGLLIFAVDSWLVGVKYDKKKKKILVGGGENSDRQIAFGDYIWEGKCIIAKVFLFFFLFFSTT
jgi:hypothetical protein